MAAISCDICGGSLSMDASGEFALCDSCGMKHTKDRVKAMAQEVTGTVAVSNIASIESLMKRGRLALEDSNWKQADECFDKVLDITPEYAPAYVGKLCAELKVRKEELLSENEKPLPENYYQKAVRFADVGYRAILEGYNKTIQKRITEVLRQKQERILDLNEIRKKITRFQNCISVSSSNTVGLKMDGTVVAVGENKDGQCNTGSWRDIVAIASGGGNSITASLRTDGTVIAAGFLGYNKDGNKCRTRSWRDIVAITIGGGSYGYIVVLKADGTVVADGYGENKWGQYDTESWRGIVAIAAGIEHTVGLRADGTVVAAGVHTYCNTKSWRDIVAITAGAAHTVGLRTDGTVVAVGVNEDGQCNTGSWRDIIAIAAGGDHTVGLRADGTVVAVGDNEDGQCNTGSWRDIGPVPEEQVLKWKQSLQWQQQGLCRYCGGTLGFLKKCKSCGQKN